MARTWTDAEVVIVRERYHRGESDAAIGESLGRSGGSVSNCRQARGIQRPLDLLQHRPWSASDLQRAERMFADGVSLVVMASHLNRTRISLKHATTERGWTRRRESADPALFDTSERQWRPSHCPGYAVSSDGLVMSTRPGRLGKLIAPYQDDDGYVHVTTTIDGRGKRVAVHRMVALAFLGQPPSPLHQVAHGDGDPSNNHAANLRWATAKENQADRVRHGTAKRHADGRFHKVKRAGIRVVEPK